jgi:hypothetical protein
MFFKNWLAWTLDGERSKPNSCWNTFVSNGETIGTEQPHMLDAVGHDPLAVPTL